MTVAELIAKLQELQARGLGECPVMRFHEADDFGHYDRLVEVSGAHVTRYGDYVDQRDDRDVVMIA